MAARKRSAAMALPAITLPVAAKPQPRANPAPAAKPAKRKAKQNVPPPQESHVPTPESINNVQALASYGVSQDDIAKVIGIAPKTLRKHYPEPLRTGKILMLAKVKQSLFQKAVGNGPSSAACAMFILKCQDGWRDRQVHEHTGGITLILDDDDKKL